MFCFVLHPQLNVCAVRAECMSIVTSHTSSCFLPPIVFMVVPEPGSLRQQLQSDSGAVAVKNRLSASEDSREEESKVLTVSSSRSDRTEERVSSSAHESRSQIQL